MDIIYRVALPGEDKKILELYRESYGRDIFSEEWHAWSNACPLGRKRIYLAEDIDAGKLAGSSAFTPYRVKIGDRWFSAILSQNTCTHPDYMGRGIFTVLGKFELEYERIVRGTEVAVGQPNKNSSRGFQKIGWGTPAELSYIEKTDFRSSRKGKIVRAFDERFDSFFERVSARFNFLVWKGWAFLNWRYSRPGADYRFYVEESGGQLIGCMIMKHYVDKEAPYCRKAHIVDMYSENDSVFMSLLETAEAFALEHHCDIMNCWQIDGSPYAKIFADFGYAPTGAKDPFIFKSLVGEPLLSEAPQNWWFSLGDNDVY